MKTSLFAMAVLMWGGLSGCSYLKEFAPIQPKVVGQRVPNQQRLVAQAAQQAVRKACAALGLKRYSGKTAVVEANGVFPHSNHDLMDYIVAAIEGEASWSGIRVHPRPPGQMMRVEGKTDQLVVAYPTSAPASPATPPPDLRLVASVDWGGIDYQDQKYIRAGKLAGQIITMVGSTGLGGGLLGVGVVEAGAPILGAGVIGTTLWMLLSPPTAHTFTLVGRVSVTIRAIPVAEGMQAARGLGQGEASIVIDTNSDTGYTNFMEVPKD